VTAVLNRREQCVECLWSQRNTPVFVEKHALGQIKPKGSECVGKFGSGSDHGLSELSNKDLRRISELPKYAPPAIRVSSIAVTKDDQVIEKFSRTASQVVSAYGAPILTRNPATINQVIQHPTVNKKEFAR